MFIDGTRFLRFRNLDSSFTRWDHGLNILRGDNGVGKTNILEALHILTGWGPFPGSRLCDTVTWESKESAYLAASVSGETECSIEVTLNRRASLKLDRSACRWGDLRGCIQSLSFLPGDMALIEGAPGVRRRFMDILCALIFPLYAYKLSEFRRILRHRRALLARGKNADITLPTMTHLASWIWECREEVVNALNRTITLWSDLLPRPIRLELKRGGGGRVTSALEDFQQSCAFYASRERSAGTPLVGPHRDDLYLICGSRPAVDVLSRGQRRRSALALIMSAASTVEQRFRQSPVLLLDEVTSELDDDGRKILLTALHRSGWQIFATTAERVLPEFEGAVWRVEHGRAVSDE